MMKKVSILIPVYNSEAFLEETIKSCCQQTYGNIEIIIVDDGSTDQSLFLSHKWSKIDTRIKVFSQKNAGACKARNMAFSKSTGAYIVYLDADDILCPEYVSGHIKRLENKDDTTISFCKWSRFHEDEEIENVIFNELPIYHDYKDSFQLLLDMWMKGEMLQTSSYMIPRSINEAVGGWDETVLKNQDGEFFSRVLINGKRALFVPQARVYYRTGEYMSVSKGTSKRKIESMLQTFVSYRENALKKEDSALVRRALAMNFTLFMYIYGNKYPDLSEIAKKEIESLGVGYQLNVEPNRVKFFVKIIGFERFLQIRKYLVHR